MDRHNFTRSIARYPNFLPHVIVIDTILPEVYQRFGGHKMTKNLPRVIFCAIPSILQIDPR